MEEWEQGYEEFINETSLEDFKRCYKHAYDDGMEWANGKIDDLTRKLEIAVGALEFYAKESNWHMTKGKYLNNQLRNTVIVPSDLESFGVVDQCGNNNLVVNGGLIAREALKQIEGES